MAFPAPGIPPLKSLTLAQIASGLDARDFTVVQLVQAHIHQIERFDSELHAVLQVNPNAIAIAQGLDAELQQSGRRSLLHGAPVLVKDNVVTHEPLEATAGSLALLGAKPARESPVVTKLRAAGCVILGTTNCSEWANFRSRPSDSGWSARGGQTYGAYHSMQDPGGSSSGSGVAVDMGYCVLAVGTETSGSIISPSKENNVVGLKPTTGLVSRDSVIPISPEQDTPGPMARTVCDAAAMLSVIAGRDEHDSKTATIPFAVIPDYHAASMMPMPAPGGKLRIGIPRNALAGVKDHVLKAFEDLVVAPLRAQQEIDIVDCTFPGIDRLEIMTVDERTNYMAGEFHDALPAYLRSLVTNPQYISGLEALCVFTKETAGEEYGEGAQPTQRAVSDDGRLKVADSVSSSSRLPTSLSAAAQRNIAVFEQSLRITRDSPEFVAARKISTYFAGPGGIQGALDGLIDSGGRGPVDALLLPTDAGSANYFAACEGHPQITVPLDYHTTNVVVKNNDTGRLVRTGPNMPFGVSVIGRKFSESTLLPICAAIEKLTRARDKADARRLVHLRN